MFDDWPALHDAFCAAMGKDPRAEVAYLSRWIGPAPAVRVDAASAGQRLESAGPATARRSLDGLLCEPQPELSTTAEPSADRPALLDIGCGTGEHLRQFRDRLQLFGIDTSPAMLRLARAKLPDAGLYLADMTAFQLERRFAVVTCLASSIGYLASCADLARAMERMAAHLEPDGLLFVEPTISAHAAQQREAKVFRFEHEGRRWQGETSVRLEDAALHVRYRLYGEPIDATRGEPVDATRDQTGEAAPNSSEVARIPPVEIDEEETLRVFTRDEICAAMEAAGLDVESDSRGPAGLGLYIGRPA